MRRCLPVYAARLSSAFRRPTFSARAEGQYDAQCGPQSDYLERVRHAGAQPGRLLHHDEQGGVRKPLGKNSHGRQRRHLCARYLAAETEFWRSHRTCAGRRYFCGLGYSRPDGETSDHFLDVETPTLDPEFQTRLRDAFAPVGLMLDFWDDKRAAGKSCDFPVVVINDLDRDWSGSVRLRLRRDGQTIADQSRPCQVKSWGTTRLVFTLVLPTRPGHCEAEAALICPGHGPVRESAGVRPGELDTSAVGGWRWPTRCGQATLETSAGAQRKRVQRRRRWLRIKRECSAGGVASELNERAPPSSLPSGRDVAGHLPRHWFVTRRHTSRK